MALVNSTLVKEFPLFGDIASSDSLSLEESEPRISRARCMTRSEFLYSFRDLPTQTAALGICDDGLPVLYDLGNTEGSALMVIGEDSSANASLLSFLVQSAVELNTPAEVRYSTISAHPDIWNKLNSSTRSSSHCLGNFAGYDRAAERAIHHLAYTAEQRHTGRQAGPAVMLIIDDLTSISGMDDDARVSLEWLLENGPQAQVWPIVSLPAKKTSGMEHWIARFDSLVIGWMPHPMPDHQGVDATRLIPGCQFAARSRQRNWLKFWLPQENQYNQQG